MKALNSAMPVSRMGNFCDASTLVWPAPRCAAPGSRRVSVDARTADRLFGLPRRWRGRAVQSGAQRRHLLGEFAVLALQAVQPLRMRGEFRRLRAGKKRPEPARPERNRLTESCALRICSSLRRTWAGEYGFGKERAHAQAGRYGPECAGSVSALTTMIGVARQLCVLRGLGGSSRSRPCAAYSDR